MLEKWKSCFSGLDLREYAKKGVMFSTGILMGELPVHMPVLPSHHSQNHENPNCSKGQAKANVRLSIRTILRDVFNIYTGLRGSIVTYILHSVIP